MKSFVLIVIKGYQKLEPVRKVIFKNLFHLDVSCKFKPTCSLYFYQAVEKYGVIKGSILGVKRIFKCNPWVMGGNDPVN